MICPACNKSIQGKNNRCECCGEDLTVYKKVYMMSNRYYNEGLEKSKVRDLSGAVIILKKSLELNKRNTDARNLLGLIYYEMGESVAALSEWVISKHFQQETNDADRYMELVQANPTRLENLNQTTKRYNAALLSAKQGNEDLAIIQLKKVTNLNPHFVKALQLLALLYMKAGDMEKALKNLTKASKIDVSNTTTLRYLKELNEVTSTSAEDGKAERKEERKVIAEPIAFSHAPYKEDKPNIWPFVNLIIGIAVGILGAMFLILPTVKDNYQSEYSKKINDNSAAVNEWQQKYDSVQKEKESQDTKIDGLNKQIEELKGSQSDDTIYEQLIKTAALYINELQKGSSSQIDYLAVADELAKIQNDKLEQTEAVALYTNIKQAVGSNASAALYEKGHDQYSARKYDDALKNLLSAYELDATNVDAVYFIGRSYHQLGDYDNAKKYYNIVIEKFPDSWRVNDAKQRMTDIQ
ncbi:tetratricopeptide repeat protein [Anaerocolumna xylanovorans]|uniref:TolA-binding protein n=1 Tax=Anaerocolumna xylanovorans DSM 12503 TaxID=1121345 RepID=A0A1M7YGY9_9FIRM|nr:tetratricopeptide repeat protein [Anaerocolumna xylanovorans]SHO51917.1 TolA-binding protein [Anaerocolumna xylanovorans DSM 12503]